MRTNRRVSSALVVVATLVLTVHTKAAVAKKSAAELALCVAGLLFVAPNRYDCGMLRWRTRACSACIVLDLITSLWRLQPSAEVGWYAHPE